jgi:hypothetical protein
LSRNGTYWNRALIGKGNGGFLLSQGDSLRLSSSTLLRFERSNVEDKYSFDLVQENEMKVVDHNYVRNLADPVLGFPQELHYYRSVGWWWCVRKGVHGRQ